MIATTKRELISNVLNKLFDYVKSDEFIAEDVKAYADSLVVSEEQAKNLDVESLLLAYVFERKVNNKFIMDIFAEKSEDLTNEERKVLEGLKNSIYSIFEIKKVLKNGFDLYNLVNEKTVPTETLIKFANFRGIGVGEFLLGRIFPFENKHYIIVLNRVFPSYSRQEALRYAVMMQMERPEALYIDNEDKLKEIEEIANNLEGKFSEYFQTNDIITTTETLDDILAGFNDFVETGSKEHSDDLNNLIKQPETYRYFNISEADEQPKGDFIDKATQGFASNTSVYDVGLMYEKDTGLLVVPFFATFKEIFRREDYKSVDGYADCIKEMFYSDKIPSSVIKMVYEEFSEKFMPIVKEVLEEDIDNIDDLLKKYKAEYYDHKKYSVPTILYASSAFNSLMQVLQEEQLRSHIMQTPEQKVGRNDPCPCGSGKKYKKCCMNL